MQPANPRQRKTHGTSRVLRPPFYVISDTHWFHHNIIKYCGRPSNHNRIMVDRWNHIVAPGDTILHLGDLFFTANTARREEFFQEIAPSLNGIKYLILGNHDRAGLVPQYEAAGFEVIRPFTMPYKGFEVTFDHYPTNKGVIQKGDNCIRVHGHIHNNGYQHVRTRRREDSRYGNVNVSVEVVNYTPQPVERLLDRAIAEMKPKQGYYNVNSKRNGTSRNLVHSA